MSPSLLLTCNSRSATISIHELDDNWRLRLVRDVVLPVAKGENSASPMVWSADGRMLFLPWRGQRRQLLSLSFDPDSADLVPAQSLPLDDDISFLSLDPAGRRLLGAGGESIVSMALSAEGFPTPVAQRVQVGPMAHCVIADDRGRGYATSCRGDALVWFNYDGETGYISNARPLAQPEGSGPRHLCLAPDGRFLYLLTQEGGEIVVFDLSGEPLAIQRLVILDDKSLGPMSGDIGITPDGRFIYATERSSNQVVGFGVDQRSGKLRRLGAVPAPDYPRALAISGAGNYLVVAGFRGHGAVIFAIEADGALTPKADYATGERPSWVVSMDLV